MGAQTRVNRRQFPENRHSSYAPIKKQFAGSLWGSLSRMFLLAMQKVVGSPSAASERSPAKPESTDEVFVVVSGELGVSDEPRRSVFRGCRRR